MAMWVRVPLPVHDPTVGSVHALPPEWIASPPETEKQIAEYFDAQFGEQFEICREVWLKDPLARRLRIDRVLKERQGRVGGLWGVELKRLPQANDGFTCFTTSLAQAVDESQSRVESDVFGADNADWFGHLLRFTFIFPCPFRTYEFELAGEPVGIGESWAQGALKLAAKFGVGAISYSTRRHDWGFFLAGHAIYWLREGPTDLAHKHAVALRRGSNR
jgi:hypothetical protein